MMRKNNYVIFPSYSPGFTFYYQIKIYALRVAGYVTISNNVRVRVYWLYLRIYYPWLNKLSD